MNQSPRSNSTWKTHPILRYGGIFVFIIIVLLASLRAAITPLAKFTITNWLGNHGVIATIEDIRLDISDGRLSLTGFNAHDANKRSAHIGTLEISWRWKPLADNRLVIHLVRLDDFYTDADFFPDGTMNIAGLSLPLADTGKEHEIDPGREDSAPRRPFEIALSGFALSKIHACLKQYETANTPVLDYCFELGSLKWNGDIKYTLSPGTTSGGLSLSVTGALSLNTIAARNMLLQRDLVKVDTIDFSNIRMDGLKKISLQKLSIASVAALERKKHIDNESGHILAFQNLSINGLQLLNMNSLAINDIDIMGLSAYLKIQKDGNFEFSEWLPRKSNNHPDKSANTKTATVANATTKTDFRYSISQIKYASTRPVIFIDDHLKEAFSYELPTLKFDLGPIDSSMPETPGHIQLAATTGRSAQLTLDASLNPLAAKPDLSGKLNIVGLDLRALSPLTRQYIGHSIRSGQLDSDITLKATKGKLDSNIALTLNQFELRALNKKEAEELNSELGFPLNTSLSLLRDRDNKIRLDIPVTGDVNNPDFDPMNAIKKATSKAVTSAVLYYYTPFGLVLAANTAFDLATALHFDPVVFPAGESKLGNSQIKQLETVSKMLVQHPGVHLTLCGTSSKVDAAELYPDSIESSDDKTTNKSALSKSQTRFLLKLAEQRSYAIKDYLVKNKNINASRLIVCEPEYRDSAEAPGVDISI